MPRAPEPRGVCIVRASREPTGLVLHITTRVDIHDTAGEVEEIEVDVDRGLASVRAFLDEFCRTNGVG